jgi:hypothetical protein
MTDIGRMQHGPVAGRVSPVSWWDRFNAALDEFFDFLMKCLCRASRGYLCPPDMTQIMYPDEPRPSNSLVKECCDEKLPRK